MEPLILFLLILVGYCGWLTIMDELRPARQPVRRTVMARRRLAKRVTATPARTAGRAGGAAVHWPVPVKGSA